MTNAKETSCTNHVNIECSAFLILRRAKWLSEMECYLSPSRLPFAIKCTCFSVLLLWIVCGFYMGDGNTDDAYGMRDITRRRPLAHYRRLLAVSKTDSQMMGVDAYEDEGYLENGSQHFDPDAEVFK